MKNIMKDTLIECIESCQNLYQTCINIVGYGRNDYSNLNKHIVDMLTSIENMVEAGIISHESIESLIISTNKKGEK